MPPIVHSSCAHDTILAWIGLALTYIIGCAADLLSRYMAGKGLQKLEKFAFKLDSLPELLGENFRLPIHCK